jgi:hypothetical protein
MANFIGKRNGERRCIVIYRAEISPVTLSRSHDRRYVIRDNDLAKEKKHSQFHQGEEEFAAFPHSGRLIRGKPLPACARKLEKLRRERDMPEFRSLSGRREE